MTTRSAASFCERTKVNFYSPKLAASLAMLSLLALTACGAADSPDSAETAATAKPTEVSSTPSKAPAASPTFPGTETSTTTEQATAEPEQSSATAATRRPADITSPDSLTVLVNKHNPLSPVSYAPADLVPFRGVQLRSEAAIAADAMFTAAAAEGVTMTALSGYRSYETQVGTYGSWAATYGQAQADVASARPGYSEHQTGLALDIGTGGGCDLQVCFADTNAAIWAAEHAHEYGFVLRYPWWHHETTGYWYESWHFRYVGVDEAAALSDSGHATLEDFWGTGAAPDYPVG